MVDECCDGTKLLRLFLADNRLSVEALQALSSFLRHCMCHSLQHLDLAFNSLGAAGMSVLVEVLPDCPSLEILNLERNKLGTSGATILFDKLQTSQKLISVCVMMLRKCMLLNLRLAQCAFKYDRRF